MPLTDAQWKVLAAAPSDGLPVKAWVISHAVWGRVPAPGGPVLRSLEKLGLVWWGTAAGDYLTGRLGWALTGAGRLALQAEGYILEGGTDD